MTPELREMYEADISRHRRDSANCSHRIKRMIAEAQATGRDHLTATEDHVVAQLLSERDEHDKNVRETQAKLDGASAQSTRKDPRMNAPAYDQAARVGQEPRTYSPETDKRGAGFLMDVARDFYSRDRDAGDRLARHMQEEKVERGQKLTRAVGTSGFSGLVVPQYLTDMYAPKVRAMRPFADICNHHDLPETGMTVNISRITTGTSVDLQTTENSAVSETDADDTLLTENVQTAAGQQTMSRQAIERGVGTEEITLQDLFKAYATNLDSTLINQATTGLAAQANSISYTDASPTAAELYPKYLNGAANIEAAVLGNAMADHVIMHSRRWFWQQSQVGSVWPFMSQPGIPTQAGAVNYATPYDGGPRGLLPNGMKVIVDNNLAINGGAGTNEDAIYVVASDECHLWEDPDAPVFIRADQAKAASLGVLLVVYGYYAYSFRRYPGSVQAVTGTGLVTPTF